MELAEIYHILPDKNSCLEFLERVRWKGKPNCPYCKSTTCTPLLGDKRYHCNRCNTSYSVTVRTIFHKTHIDIQKWLFTLTRLNGWGWFTLSSRQLASQIGVDKNTALFMMNRIYRDLYHHRELIEALIEELDLEQEKTNGRNEQQ